MSRASYKRNRELGITGPETGTCFPAALDQLTLYRGVQPETYYHYEEIVDIALSYRGQQRRERNPLYKYLYGQIAVELGATYDDYKFRRLRTRRGFVNSVARMIEDGDRVAIDILTDDCKRGRDGYCHTVGLVPVYEDDPEIVRLVSSWVPDDLRGEVSLAELFKHLHQPIAADRPSESYAFNGANVISLPPQRIGND
ncbi:MAG TPA: hypothetical protein VHB51_03790 [Candidatus Saccharimonadales bacterium]|nr:hypothetical protein [Candidatus Saccharimonadales bacterium]